MKRNVAARVMAYVLSLMMIVTSVPANVFAQELSEGPTEVADAEYGEIYDGEEADYDLTSEDSGTVEGGEEIPAEDIGSESLIEEAGEGPDSWDSEADINDSSEDFIEEASDSELPDETAVEEAAEEAEEVPEEDYSGEDAVAKEETEEPDAPEYTFDQSVEIDGVTVTLRAKEGVFPEDASLYVEKVPEKESSWSSLAVESGRDKTLRVLNSYSFSVQVLDAAGQKLSPSDGKKFEIVFSPDQVPEGNPQADIWQIVRTVQEENVEVAEEAELPVEDEDLSVETEEESRNRIGIVEETAVEGTVAEGTEGEEATEGEEGTEERADRESGTAVWTAKQLKSEADMTSGGVKALADSLYIFTLYSSTNI